MTGIAVHEVAAPSQAKPKRKIAALVLVVAFAVWMMSPLLTASYVEAYVARLQSIATMKHLGSLALDDQAYPMSTEMLSLTRPGVIALYEGLYAATGKNSMSAARALNTAGFVILIFACWCFTRTWSRVSVVAFCLAVVLTPGILEVSFFIADNVLSAACVGSALAVVSARRSSWVRYAIVGALFALGAWIRLDAVFSAPLIAGVMWYRERRWRNWLTALALVAITAMVVYLGALSMVGISVLQQWRGAAFFSRLNNNSDIYQTGAPKTIGLIAVGFFGLISLGALACGVVAHARRRAHVWTLIFVVLPCLFYVSVLPRANEIRDFCLLASPFVLMHVAKGLEVTYAWLRASPFTVWKGLALAGVMAVLFCPPYISMRDGPRALLGRIYSPIFWRQWQGRTADLLQQVRHTVNEPASDGGLLIITSQFEPDRYTHLVLLASGYRPRDESGSAPMCQSVATYTNGSKQVTLLRTENPYGIVRGPQSGDDLENLQLAEGLRCVAGRQFDRAYFFSVGRSGVDYEPGLLAPEIEIPKAFPLPRLHHAQYGYFRSVPLSAEDLRRLSLKAEQQLPPVLLGERDHDEMMRALHRLTAARYWKPH